jgi:hypothetical membrane protein
MKSHKYYAGAILWLLSAQYYIVQVMTANGWAKINGYSWANNTISDLANTRCGAYGDRLVCSPLHTLMNGSFILLGITMAAGSLLLWPYLAVNRPARLGLACMVIAGAGTILIGLFPENTVSALHITGAALPFILGNFGMILLGIAFDKFPPLLRGFSILCGSAGLIALVLFMTQTYLGLGIGGMERLAAYPQSIWMIVTATFLILKK